MAQMCFASHIPNSNVQHHEYTKLVYTKRFFLKFGLKKDFKMLKSFFKPNFQNKGWYKQVWYIHDAVH